MLSPRAQLCQADNASWILEGIWETSSFRTWGSRRMNFAKTFPALLCPGFFSCATLGLLWAHDIVPPWVLRPVLREKLYV